MSIRHKWVTFTILAVSFAGLSAFTAWSVPPRPAEIREVMQEKLMVSQRILEGVATENYLIIGNNAQRLNRLSQMRGWGIRETAEYKTFTTDFRRHADALAAAAKAENIDAATLSYFQLTMSCVNCHRYLRETAIGALPTSRPADDEALAQLIREQEQQE